jgi:hypothetical protein
LLVLTLGFLTALLLSSCGYSPESWLSFLPVNVAACDKPLAAEIRMVAPHWGPPRADMDVVWEVIATGAPAAIGWWNLQAQPFRAFSHYSKVYGSVRRVEERVTVQSIDWRRQRARPSSCRGRSVYHFPGGRPLPLLPAQAGRKASAQEKIA